MMLSEEDIAQRKFLSTLAAYAVMGFMSFGYAWNHPTEWDQVCTYYGVNLIKDENGKSQLGNVYCSWIPPIKSIAAGIFWPIYAPGVFAIHVTKWP